MKTKNRESAPRDEIGGRPRRAVASYATYAEAERAVDHLSDQKFPVERVSIVARDLKVVEQVTGRRGYLEAALHGLTSGALIGALIGWLFGSSTGSNRSPRPSGWRSTASGSGLSSEPCSACSCMP
ncbi:MAG TPA: general stress protein [Solirubrobacterales bacterium]|nr:general stress protein [Solirubrobacterales bacterium]